MFPTTNTLPRINEALTKSVSGIIVLPQNPSLDAIASATSLYLGLLKLGKTVTLVCSSPVQTDMHGGDKIQQSLSVGGNSLVVSFPYADGAVDKIDYNIQGQSFNLIVTPREGFPKLNPNQVSYSYTGGSFDFIITIDLPNLNSIGQLYTDNQSLFQGKTIINIDRHLTNGFFGTINHVNKTSSSTSELVMKVLQNLSIEIDKDIATNLYSGIAAATNSFTSYSVNAETFETIAQLLKQGAVKKITPKSNIQQPSIQHQSPFSVMRQSIQPPQTNQVPQIQQTMPQAQPSFEHRTSGTIDTIEQASASQIKEGAPTPQDWLKPKIFKGGGLV